MKDFKISKKLLSEVLKRPVEIIDIDEYECMIRNSTCFDNEQKGIIYRYLYGNEEIRFMSIYELVHKNLKQWALNKNYTLSSSVEIDCGYCDISFIINNKAKHKLITEASEIEAIIKACEWILNQEAKND